jgi:hypothetical protein
MRPVFVSADAGISGVETGLMRKTGLKLLGDVRGGGTSPSSTRGRTT